MSFRTEVLQPVVRHEDTPPWLRTSIMWTSPAHYITLVVYAVLIIFVLVWLYFTDTSND